ncbi:MAG: type II toxin-antitoxin system prevent-host-death family antitoxin [Firmicutes bacterium]|nr:type II toxin-antitoxin system prevent-host-death family antitoxin [Bacillota bacterium]
MYIGIREAKAQLSNLLKKVQDGSNIIITDHGKPIAKLTRLENEELPLYHRIAALEQAGVLSHVKETTHLPPPLPVQADIQTILQEDRNRG